MFNFRVFATLLLLAAAGTAGAQQASPQPQVTELMSKVLADYPGKEAVIITVEFPPGAADPVHRHNAHGFVYVLQGSIVMGVRGGESVTLHPGQTFYEGPNDIHTVGRNASLTEPAKFLVVLLKDKGEPIFTPVR
ncbi:cupin domain-containing protein [Pseudomonas gingeri]|uniref:cupin domain-containing protein n=1 Tax=Pseudomonas gingeri TaxID=117681 RepID=UPI0015BB5258|nr:cupin domain-containing protein [Pseudomonas gingeri]NWD48408.1 cupin domain-containing protein [Pseudomonas gingeri]